MSTATSTTSSFPQPEIPQQSNVPATYGMSGGAPPQTMSGMSGGAPTTQFQQPVQPGSAQTYGVNTAPGAQLSGFMRAAVTTQYGGPEVIRLVDNWPKPFPGPTQLLVKVVASSVNPVDCMIREGTLPPVKAMMSLPTVQGIDFSGVVEAVGGLHSRFKPGDKVFGRCKKGGAWAEYCLVTEDVVTAKPEQISHEVAAAAPVVTLTAYAALIDRGHIQRGTRVLILGGSGGVGSYAVKLAKHFGAYVAATCSDKNVDWVRSLGADQVVAYNQQDPRAALQGQQFDIVFDTVGGDDQYAVGKVLMAPTAKFISTIGPMHGMEKPGWLGFAKTSATTAFRVISKKVAGSQTYDIILPNELRDTNLPIIAQLMLEGVTPLAETILPFSQVVEANQKVQGHHARGKVVLAHASSVLPYV